MRLSEGTKYIKLGLGKSFIDTKINLILTPQIAGEVHSSLILNMLSSFFLTGFLVEISKVEYDDFKLRNQNATNIPLTYKEVGTNYNFNALENILSTPPNNPPLNSSYLIDINATKEWTGRKDFIATWDGAQWEYLKPGDGMYAPIYFWGTAAQYTGHYPSGSWGINKQTRQSIDAGEKEEEETTYAQRLFDRLVTDLEKLRDELNSRIDDIEPIRPIFTNEELLRLATVVQQVSATNKFTFEPGTSGYDNIIDKPDLDLLIPKTTDDLLEGPGRLYYTEARVIALIQAALSGHNTQLQLRKTQFTGVLEYVSTAIGVVKSVYHTGIGNYLKHDPAFLNDVNKTTYIPITKGFKIVNGVDMGDDDMLIVTYSPTIYTPITSNNSFPYNLNLTLTT